VAPGEVGVARLLQASLQASAWRGLRIRDRQRPMNQSRLPDQRLR
jgi:hypothetical protein